MLDGRKKVKKGVKNMSVASTSSSATFNHYKRFISDSISVFLGYIFIYGRGFILMPLLIKNVGISLYGGYVVLFTGLGFISGVSTLGVGFSFRRFLPSSVSVLEKRKLLYPQFIFQLVSILAICLILIILSDSIEGAFFKNQINFSMWLAVPILVVTVVYSASNDYFRYTQRIKRHTLAVTSESYLMVLFVVIAIVVFHKKNINMLLLAELCALIVVSIPLALKIYKEIGCQFLIPSRDFIVKEINLGFPLTLAYIVDFILSGSDKFIIAFLLSVKEVGYYSPAYALASYIILFPKVFGVVLPPLLSKATDSGEHDLSNKLISYTLKSFILVSVPFIIGSIILGYPLLLLLTNKEVADAAYITVPIIASGIFFYGLNLILCNILFVRMETKGIFSITAVSALLNLILNIVFIYIFRSILVAAVTTFIGYFVGFTILCFKLKDTFEIKYYIPIFLKSFFASIFMAAILYYGKLTLGSSLWAVLTLIFSGILLYILFISILKVFKKSEINFVRNYLMGLNKS
ncbi:MAG: oligosaccharide flippase family protein [Candidatus Omnitrophica bacterium]|nr:oligosaccharide flippase family protein [Candidatus Omnitrophota bacterium]